MLNAVLFNCVTHFRLLSSQLVNRPYSGTWHYTQSWSGFKAIKSSSLKVHLSAIRSLHILYGSAAPPTSTPRDALVLKSISYNGLGQSRSYPSPILYSITYVLNYVTHKIPSFGLLQLPLGFFAGLIGAEYSLAPPY